MTDTPEHRASVAIRSGDTHVIGDDGLAVNVDQPARDEAAKAEAAEAAKAERRAKPVPPALPDAAKAD